MSDMLRQLDEINEQVKALQESHDALVVACKAAWTLGHRVYHNANNHEAHQRDWPEVRELIRAALDKAGAE